MDKQAAARCWRDGQRYQCYTYRFVSSGTLEERMLQRQLSKEGLQNVIEDKDQVRASASTRRHAAATRIVGVVATVSIHAGRAPTRSVYRTAPGRRRPACRS